MEFILIAGLATFINFAVIYVKFNKEMYANAILDVAVFATIAWLFSGTLGGMSIGMIASALFSMLLLIVPPKFEGMAV